MNYEWNMDMCKGCKFFSKRDKLKQVQFCCEAVKNGTSLIGGESKGYSFPNPNFFPPEDCPYYLESIMISQGEVNTEEFESFEGL